MTNLDVINAALTRTGSKPITSLDEAGAMAAVARTNYEPVVTAALRSYPWRWASTAKQLNLLDEATQGPALPPWRFTYQIPTDVLLLRAVKVSGKPIPYDTMQDLVFTNLGAEAVVVATYTARVPEWKWDPMFRDLVIQKLEAVFLRSREAHAEAEARDRASIETQRLLQLRDSQRQPVADPRTYPLLRARRG